MRVHRPFFEIVGDEKIYRNNFPDVNFCQSDIVGDAVPYKKRYILLPLGGFPGIKKDGNVYRPFCFRFSLFNGEDQVKTYCTSEYKSCIC